MPVFAHLQVKVPCPQCGVELAPAGAIGFQWGYCSNPHSGPYFTYEVGDALLWRQDHRGNVPAWVYFRDGSANIGDPAFANLVVRESEYEIRACRACQHSFAGIAVIVVTGRISEARVFLSDGSLPECDIMTRDASGNYTPRPEWQSHLMDSGVNGGWRTRLVEMPELLSHGGQETRPG